MVHPGEAYVVGKTRQKHQRKLPLGLDKRGYGKPFFMRLQILIVTQVTKTYASAG